MNKSIVLHVVLIAVVGFAVYANSLSGEFIWDDIHLVKNNPHIRNWSHLPTVFTKGILAGVDKESDFYRPLQILSYTLDYSLWKQNVVGYHLTNIVLHVLVALTVYFLITLLFKDSLLSLLTGLLFVVHPVHTEAVTYISGRADSLAALFMLLCFIFYIRGLDSRKYSSYIIMILTFSLALLSRENTLIFPLILLFYHVAFKKRIDTKGFISVLMISLLYIALRTIVLKDLLSQEEYTSTVFTRLPGFFAAFATYLRLLIFPSDLHMEYGDTLFRWTQRPVLIGLVLFAIIIIYALRKKEKPLVFFSIGWFFILLLPHANLYPLTSFMAEHWLYLPSIGFFLLVAGFFTRSPLAKHRPPALIAFAVLLSLYSTLTVKQNAYWQKPLAFYARTLKYAPESPRVLNNLGNLYHDLGKDEEAMTLFQKAIEIDPQRSATYYNLANVYRDRRQSREAIDLYNKALQLEPDYSEAYNNLGLVLFDSGRKQEAIALFKKVLESNPDYAPSYNNLGNAYHAIGEKDKAIASFNKALELDPEYVEAYNNLGLAYFDDARTKEAIALYKKAISLDPDYAKAYSNLGIAYHALGDVDRAIDSFKKAIALEPENTAAYSNLGVVYNAQGRPDEAISLYKKALEFNQDPETYNNLGITYRAQGRKDEAIDAYKKAIAIDQDYAKAYYNLGNVYTDIGRHEEAFGLYVKAAELNPSTQVYNNLGLSLYTLGRYEEAIQAYKKAISLGPEYARAYNNLAIAYFRLQQYSLAIEYYDKAAQLGFTNPQLSELLKPYRNQQ